MNSKIEEQSHKNRRLLIWAASLTFSLCRFGNSLWNDIRLVNDDG